MVNVTVRGLCREHAITARQLANGLRGAGEKGPAAEIGAESPGIFLEHLRGVALRIDRNGDEGDLSAEVTPEPIVNERHHWCKNRTGVGAQSIDERSGDHLAAEVRQADRRTILRRQE